MLSLSMNMAPTLRPIISTFGTRKTRRVPSLERCRDQITDTLTFTTRIILTITRANRIARRNTMTDILRPMCWKSGLLGVIAAICCLGISCLVVTPSSWVISPERYTERPGQDFTSLDDSPMLPCENWSPVLLRDCQGHWSRSQYALPCRAPAASGPESLVLRQSPKPGLPLTLPR